MNKADASFSTTCPFAKLALALSPPQLHLGMPSSHGSTPASDSTPPSSYGPSPLMTPSFEINTPEEVAPVPELIALIQRIDTSDPKKSLQALDMPDLDFSRNVSALLKDGTARAHVQAENSLGAAALVRGELGLEEYVRWLAVLWRLYDALELALNEHATNSVLAPTYDPAVLARADSLAQDITYLLTLLPESITSAGPSSGRLPDGPLPPFALPSFLSPVFTDPPSALTLYLDHIRHLASSGPTASGLLAHSYVRYLGDLSGGQFIAAKIKRAYNLDQGLDGLRFYHFDLQGGHNAAEESRADGRRRAGEVKDWFRKGMDEGVGEDEDLKATLVREANLAFALNTYLFSVIRVAPQSSGTGPARAPVAASTATAAEPPLRYYEKRQLEQEAKRRQDAAQTSTTSSTSWHDKAERFAIFGATVVVGWALGQYVLPFASDLLAEKTGFGRVEL